MKSKLTIFFIGLLVVLGVLSAIYIITLKKEVSFDFKNDDFSVNIYNERGQEVSTLTSSEKVKLRKGSYSYAVIGDGYSAKVTPFTVESDVNITVSPHYKEGYLTTLAEREKPEITSIIQRAHPSVEDIVITQISVNSTAEWAYGKLTINNATSDIYRFVMKKKDTTWTIAAGPAIALSKKDAPDIPEAILYSLY